MRPLFESLSDFSVLIGDIEARVEAFSAETTRRQEQKLAALNQAITRSKCELQQAGATYATKRAAKQMVAAMDCLTTDPLGHPSETDLSPQELRSKLSEHAQLTLLFAKCAVQIAERSVDDALRKGDTFPPPKAER
ncbi:hypothetical protein [Shimia sagamensis]|uniref:FlgN protein n=1 Tax=Shimia sagamensis TaxID=1566352 RepID=A0ABY1NR73_9RHOB|nr:hypothetical protein [Shimia sagamensis]SMP15940.1 hypothetical protein SAMN06265373_1032 [Shimia sagamensis]